MARPDGFLKRYYKVVNQNLQKIKTVYRMYYHNKPLINKMIYNISNAFTNYKMKI